MLKLIITKMSGREQVSVALIEHDSNNDVLCVWSYPGFHYIIDEVVVVAD